jgi:hypothetical protein
VLDMHFLEVVSWRLSSSQIASRALSCDSQSNQVLLL